MPTIYDNDTRADLERVYAPVFEEFTGTFSPDGLIAEARAATGLADLGGEAMHEPGFLTRLTALCNALETEANLTALGRTRAHCRCFDCTSCRTRGYSCRHACCPIIRSTSSCGCCRQHERTVQ